MVESQFLIPVTFWAGLIVNEALELRMIHDVKVHLPDDARFHYFHWWILLDEIHLWQEHRRLYPASKLRILSVVAGVGWLPFAIVYGWPLFKRWEPALGYIALVALPVGFGIKFLLRRAQLNWR